MLFNSLSFLVYFPVVVGLFFLMAHKYRWLWLLAASCFFYMFFKPVYILILAFTIIIDYIAAIELEKANGRRKRRLLLIISLAGNILVLAVFKYYNFINENITGVLGVFNLHNPIPYLQILLPIGLSFHTFQAMSYIIEVYRGNQKAEKHFGYYALYVMFFPQLVAGPIERPQNILHQLHEEKKYDYANFSAGLKMMIYGLFKKVVIADNIARLVNEVYSTNSTNGLACIVAMALFSIQIYCDFSGYSYIALGTARCMGYDLMKNFALPYSSASVTEFWRRWHISLSTWFRDYLYVPLGGNAGNKAKGYINLGIIFLVSGLWHGASWNYIIWGGVHAVILIAEKLFLLKIYSRLPLFITITWNFVLITFTWLLFRIEDFSKLREILGAIATIPYQINKQTIYEVFVILGKIRFLVLGLLVVLFMIFDRYFYTDLYTPVAGNKNFLQKLQYPILVTTILIFGFVGDIQFIYFQF